MTALGRSLEAAVSLGCRRYRDAQRADIWKQATPMRRYSGEWRFSEKANADYAGVIAGGGSFRAECKETNQTSYAIFHEKIGLKDHQRKALERADGLGSTSGLILAFLPSWEVYFIPIKTLVPFLDAPWRRSVTPDMARAWGKLLPVGVTAGNKLYLKFLDGVDHPDRANALTRVEADRLANPLELELEAPAKPRAEKPLTGKGSPFDLLEIAKRARKLGVRGKKWSER